MDDNKKLGLILAGIVLIILIIFGIYFTTYVFKINQSEEITTTTKKQEESNNVMPIEEPSIINESLSDNLIIAFNNSFNNNYNIKNLDLFESEESKFKYIYTYFKLIDPELILTYEDVNNYSQQIFETSLYADNFSKYLKDNYYEYEIQYQDIKYCLYAVFIKDDRLILDMIETDSSCADKSIDYNSNDVKHQISVKYKIIDNNYIYNSFIIIK
ncbi:MAG: hypothetical protein PHX04_00100 [Bacilli bacterium]|nr:hypothetical protein [Bacilli bacterium]